MIFRVNIESLNLPVNKSDHRKGPDSALVKIVEYGDFQCPHCAHAHFILKQVVKVLGDEIQLVYRHFPLTRIHHDALNAARAAEAAAKQSRFWLMHDLLFENQDSLNRAAILTYAMDLHLDLEQFIQDVASTAVEEHIKTDIQSGTKSSVIGTPTFYINKWKYEGDLSLTSLLYSLQNELIEARQIMSEQTGG
jgi:protein-disulfide isomerase